MGQSGHWAPHPHAVNGRKTATFLPNCVLYKALFALSNQLYDCFGSRGLDVATSRDISVLKKWQKNPHYFQGHIFPYSSFCTCQLLALASHLLYYDWSSHCYAIIARLSKYWFNTFLCVQCYEWIAEHTPLVLLNKANIKIDQCMFSTKYKRVNYHFVVNRYCFVCVDFRKTNATLTTPKQY